MTTLRRLWGLLSISERKKSALLIVGMVVGAGAEAVGIGLVVPFISILADPESSFDSPFLSWLENVYSGKNPTVALITIASILMGLVVTKNFYLAWLNFSVSRFVFGKEASISSSLLQRYLSMPYSEYINGTNSERIRVLTSEVSRFAHGFLLPGMTLIAECLVCIFIIFLLAVVEPLLTLFMLLSLGGVLFIASLSFRTLINRYKDIRSVQNKLMFSQVQHALDSIKEIKILGREQFFEKKYAQSLNTYSHATQVFTAINQTPRLAIEVTVVCGLLTSIIVMLSHGDALKDVFVLLALYAVAALRIMPSMSRILSAINSMRFYSPAVDIVSKEMASLDRQTEKLRSSSFCDSSEIPLERISFVDVYYRHDKMTDWILECLSFEIRKGEVVALAGASGAGKSTLGDLLLGLISPIKGIIQIDGQNLDSIRDIWKRYVGFVPQDINLLDDSIRRNVAFGIPDNEINDEQVWSALDLARLGDKVRSERGGLDYPVGEHGGRLSGGERQRIGIARALYGNPKLLVLDEATSALDNQTELEIADTLMALGNDKTVLIIAHRLETLKRCDRILVLANRKIVANDTYDNLQRNNPYFSKLTGSTHLDS